MAPMNTRSIARMQRRMGAIIEYEPSWFTEFLSAFGIGYWGLTTLFHAPFGSIGSGLAAWMLAFGMFRVRVLVRLAPTPRVICAGIGFVFWMACAWNTDPVPGASGAIALGELLTVAKFSLWAARLPKGA